MEIKETTAVNLAAQIIARYRQTAIKFGPFFGRQIYTIIATTPDLKWKEDVQFGKNTLRQEIKAYVIKAIDVKSLALLEQDVDKRPKVIMNEKDNDVSLVFELAEPEFSKATRDNVLRCIELLDRPGSKPIFFTAEDLHILVQLVEQANQGSLTVYENLSRKYLQLGETVRGIMEQNNRLQVEYLRQCGVGETETELKATVVIEETVL